MGWISVLKVVAKIAVEYGAVEWAKGWLKRRARGRVDAAKKKYDKQYKVYKEFVDAAKKKYDKQYKVYKEFKEIVDPYITDGEVTS
jgi:hypothetical protein